MNGHCAAGLVTRSHPVVHDSVAHVLHERAGAVTEHAEKGGTRKSYTEVTQIKPEVIESAVLVARAGYLAIMTDPKDFSAISLLDRLIKVTEDESLSGWLRELRAGLEENLGTHAMAVRLGWGDRIPATAGPTAIMAIYAWLRNHQDFEKVVESAASHVRAGVLGACSARCEWL